MNAVFKPSSEVARALAARQPLVALESTIVAHGLPWPENLEVGRALEETVRAHGAVPATIAVIDGVVRVGLEPAQLERIAREPATFRKANSADLAVVSNAATTVSATAFVAAQAGIAVFATGGIGGVHRGEAGDVSSDLTVLARVPLAVVSAGAKAVLDLPRTLEMLETLGVLVLGLGTGEFPAFYTRTSGLKLEHRVDSPQEAARVCARRRALGDRSGVLVANPIPAEDALPDDLVREALAGALAEAAARGVHGKALTPFLLAQMAARTGRRSLDANRALAVNNARVAAEMAAALAGPD